MAKILAIGDHHGPKVIEDCAHAIETEYHGRKAGTFGDFGCFGFYVVQNVATGEGGMVLARAEADIGRAKILALHGMSKDAWDRFSPAGVQVSTCASLCDTRHKSRLDPRSTGPQEHRLEL